MAVKNTVALYIDGINRTSNMVMPFKWGNFLDERLDECHISLRAIQRKKIFQPLTPVEIQLNNEIYWGSGVHRVTESKRERTKYYIVANDSVTETQVGANLYNHELDLIEVTKIAECFVVDTITFTNDIVGRDYTNNIEISKAQPVYE